MWFGESRKMSTWERLKDFATRFDQMVLRRKDPTPSSMSIGITATPNFPLPASWLSSSGDDKLALVTKSDHNALQQLNHDTLGKKRYSQRTPSHLANLFVLEPQKIFTYRDYDKRLDGQLAAAHHHYDYVSQETINMTMSVGSSKPTLQVFSIDTKGHTRVLASIQHGLDADKTPMRPFYYHSFFITENYVVVPMCPMYYKNNGADLLLNGSVLGGLEWEPETPTFFHIVDRHHGKGHVATLVGPSYFAFHVINARDYQENGSIRFELDCAAYDGKMIYETHAFGDIIRTSEYHSKYLQNKNTATQKHNGIDYPALHCDRFGDYRRYHLTWNPSSLVSPATHYETMLTNFDFPRIHSAYTSKAHRYTYGCQILAPTPDRGEQYCLVKIDLNTKEWVRFQHQDKHQNGYLCSEPIFVARPRRAQEEGPQKEDDGVVLSLVNVFDNKDAAHDYCYLLVLDAASFTQLAQVPIGSFIAPTFHGSYDAEHSFELGSFN